MGDETHRFIEIDARALDRQQATELVTQALRRIGYVGPINHMKRQPAPAGSLLRDGRPAPSLFEFMVDGTMGNGVVAELDYKAWLKDDRFGEIGFAKTVRGGAIALGSGGHSLPALQGPGYATYAVVAEIAKDVLHYRSEAARTSFSPFWECFRAVRSYLSACISLVDAFLNRRAWYVLQERAAALSSAEAKSLSDFRKKKLHEKVDALFPIATGSAFPRSTSAAWAAFDRLKGWRNSYIHVNDPGFAFEIEAAVGWLNECRLGVGGLLHEMNAHLGVHPHPSILCVKHAPLARFVDAPFWTARDATPSTGPVLTLSQSGKA